MSRNPEPSTPFSGLLSAGLLRASGTFTLQSHRLWDRPQNSIPALGGDFPFMASIGCSDIVTQQLH